MKSGHDCPPSARACAGLTSGEKTAASLNAKEAARVSAKASARPGSSHVRGPLHGILASRSPFPPLLAAPRRAAFNIVGRGDVWQLRDVEKV
jgi:hypothetical protein